MKMTTKTKETEVKKSADELAFDKFISNERYANAVIHIGKFRLREIFLAGVKRENASKK